MASGATTMQPAVNRGATLSSSASTIDVNSYFSPQAPSATSVASPASPVTSPSASDHPVITATVTSRNSSGETSSSNMTAHEQALREFALHIPNPPMLSMAAAAARHQQQPSLAIPNGVPAIHSPTHSSLSRTVHTPGYDDLPSPMDRSRRMPPSTHAPQMTVSTNCYFYTLCVKLPAAIQPEMVTVCAKKGDKLTVVADVWHLEDESHYEWQISFPPRDIDMSTIHARFDAQKNLTIDVRRIPRVYR